MEYMSHVIAITVPFSEGIKKQLIKYKENVVEKT